MSFTGTERPSTARGSFNLQLQSVRFVLSQNGLITGTFEEVWSSGTTSASGTARYFAELRGMTRRD